jgi:Flp pilus assembly protein TadB
VSKAFQQFLLNIINGFYSLCIFLYYSLFLFLLLLLFILINNIFNCYNYYIKCFFLAFQYVNNNFKKKIKNKTGEIKTHTAEHKKTSFAWESKSILDRSQRKEILLQKNFNDNIFPLDSLVEDFKQQMRMQLEQITIKLQAVINGRENDVNARKASIHKKLAKHVNKSCNARFFLLFVIIMFIVIIVIIIVIIIIIIIIIYYY